MFISNESLQTFCMPNEMDTHTRTHTHSHTEIGSILASFQLVFLLVFFLDFFFFGLALFELWPQQSDHFEGESRRRESICIVVACAQQLSR